MSNNSIKFTIDLNGNAYKGILQIDNSLKGVLNSVDNARSAFKKLGDASVRFDGITSTIQNLQSAIGGITQAGANAELQLMNLKTLFGGNAEAAEEMYERISEYGKVTPYDKAGLIEAQRTMMSFGVEGEKAFETLKQIGDIAMGDSGKMQSLSLAFAQMSSTGKLTGQDLMQMVNAGFNPLQEISKQTGKSVADLKKEMEKGAVSVGMVEAAFQSATSEGGLFHNAIAEASETTAGKMAAIQDTIEEVKVAIFNATGDFGLWVDAAAQVALPIAQLSPLFSVVGGAIKWTKKQWDKFRKAVNKGTVNTVVDLRIINTAIVATGAFFKGLAATAKVACKAIGTAIKNIPIIGWIAAAIAAVIALFQLLWERCEGFRRLLFGLWEVIKAIASHLWSVFKEGVAYVLSIVKPFIDTIKSYVSELWINIVEGATRIGEFFVGVWTWISTTASEAFDWIVQKLGIVGTWISERLVKPIIDTIKNYVSSLWANIVEGATWLWTNIVEGATWLWQTVVNVATEIGDFFVGVWEWISTSATSAFDWIVAKLGAVGKWISEHFIAPLRNAFSSVWEWIGTVVDKMLSGLSGLFEPIRKLWNKLFPDDLIEDVKQAYAIGAEKGSASFRADQKEKEDEESGVLWMANESLQPILKPKTQKENTNGNGNGLNGGSLGRSAGEVAGKAQQINITLEKMVETINFNGTMKENSNDVEQRLREIMARILGMAETAI